MALTRVQELNIVCTNHKYMISSVYYYTVLLLKDVASGKYAAISYFQ